MSIIRGVVLYLIVALIASVIPPVASAQPVIADHDCVAEFDFIPASVILQARDDYRMFYIHTSHGSQPLQGMSIIESLDGQYQPPSIVEYSDDLGEGGDVSWIPIIGNYLDTNTDGCNLVSISWCYGAYTYDEAQTDVYLRALDSLGKVYPNVIFMYQTSRMPSPLWDVLDPSRRIDINRTNNQIRAYCDTAAGEKYLFDFGDIESWDPDDNYYADATDTCLWCIDWCATHSCPDCVNSDQNWLYGDDECAHSHCFNCYRKGKAFWWLLARLTGWKLPTSVDDEDPNLPGEFSLEQNFPNPFNPSTTIEYHLPSQSPVDLAVYNLLGQRVKRLVRSSRLAGTHRAVWDGTDEAGNSVASGVYFYRLKTDTFTGTRKMVLQR